ncbi:hypothetical protein A2625_01915 [candidate division WOR-1 bacterium RIFCSPHIGHO2_01_FULL_53_15]|uniref:Uncharacterized protein n=1 Tax=candidate division WOR-1 bacterium RIFCSPHIGHO2_01_FULL_53_15 TaxID=1802564 RepID=A0A1F4Q205_UNCSA|nr:MAG: hypothetical protein A2625_01915 [candidate division WOR-1 bacterium RIFCSPHIGHO2_01_FULL_53_15]OGC13594.1 MAG: hypothetical protein A3D23_06090 [candidate division WOR-1 bacterium RIFCSPHIGHO2_02_FULL_53_26]
MSIKGPAERPFIPQITPKEIKPEKGPEEKLTPQPAVKMPIQPGIGRGPELDAHAIATRLALLATEAKEKELKFADIIDRIIAETGMTNPQGAMEEANRKIQREIEEEIAKIKENKELMDEAEGWQMLERMLLAMNEEQAGAFLGLLREAVKGL